MDKPEKEDRQPSKLTTCGGLVFRCSDFKFARIVPSRNEKYHIEVELNDGTILTGLEVSHEKVSRELADFINSFNG